MKKSSIYSIGIIMIILAIVLSCSKDRNWDNPIDPLNGQSENNEAEYSSSEWVTNRTLSGMISTNEVWAGIINPTGDITIPYGTTLKILAGTYIYCPAEFTLNNYGVLEISGVSNSEVVFTNVNSSGDWDRIYCAGTSYLSANYINIYKADYGFQLYNSAEGVINYYLIDNCLTYCLDVHDNSEIVLNNGIMSSSHYRTINASGNADIIISKTIIKDSYGTGIKIDRNTSLTLSKVLLENNGWTNSNPAITTFGFSSIYLTYVDLVNNSLCGICAAEPCSSISLVHCYIASNNGATTYTTSTSNDDSLTPQQYLSADIVYQPRTTRQSGF